MYSSKAGRTPACVKTCNSQKTMSATWRKERSTIETNEIMKTAAHRSESRRQHYAPAAFYSTGKLLVVFSVRGWVDPRGHSVAGRIKSVEKSNGLIGIRTSDLPACITVPQPTTLPRAFTIYTRAFFIYLWNISWNRSTWFYCNSAIQECTMQTMSFDSSLPTPRRYYRVTGAIMTCRLWWNGCRIQQLFTWDLLWKQEVSPLWGTRGCWTRSVSRLQPEGLLHKNQPQTIFPRLHPVSTDPFLIFCCWLNGEKNCGVCYRPWNGKAIWGSICRLSALKEESYILKYYVNLSI
jgi:hypothetical protein